MDTDSNLTAARNSLINYFMLPTSSLYSYETKEQKAYSKYTTLALSYLAHYIEY